MRVDLPVTGRSQAARHQPLETLFPVNVAKERVSPGKVRKPPARGDGGLEPLARLSVLAPDGMHGREVESGHVALVTLVQARLVERHARVQGLLRRGPILRPERRAQHGAGSDSVWPVAAGGILGYTAVR